MTTHCIWTGRPLPAPVSGGKPRKFVNDRARADAHRAARKYTLAMIERGDLTWEELREWDRTQENGS